MGRDVILLAKAVWKMGRLPKFPPHWNLNFLDPHEVSERAHFLCADTRKCSWIEDHHQSGALMLTAVELRLVLCGQLESRGGFTDASMSTRGGQVQEPSGTYILSGASIPSRFKPWFRIPPVILQRASLSFLVFPSSTNTGQFS